MREQKIKELEFRGNKFKICYYDDTPQEPSWFSFDDESGVRDRDWDIKPGDVVFDIGSAYGSYALTALASGAKEAVCWNPNNDENTVLHASANENGWDSDRLFIFDSGLWSSHSFLRDTDLKEFDGPYPGAFEVRALDDYLERDFAELPHLDWIKMDVEGAEVEVLKGAEQTIRRFKPRILVELHLFKDGTLSTQVTELLASYGYRKVSEHPYHAVAHAVYESV